MTSGPFTHPFSHTYIHIYLYKLSALFKKVFFYADESHIYDDIPAQCTMANDLLYWHKRRCIVYNSLWAIWPSVNVIPLSIEIHFVHYFSCQEEKQFIRDEKNDGKCALAKSSMQLICCLGNSLLTFDQIIFF